MEKFQTEKQTQTEKIKRYTPSDRNQKFIIKKTKQKRMKSSVIALVACTATANKLTTSADAEAFLMQDHANDYNQRGMSTRLCSNYHAGFTQCLRTYCLIDLSEYYYSTMETVFNNAPHMTTQQMQDNGSGEFSRIRNDDGAGTKWYRNCAYEYGRNAGKVSGMPTSAEEAIGLCACNYKPERKWPNLAEEIFYGDTNCDLAYGSLCKNGGRGCYYKWGNVVCRR